MAASVTPLKPAPTVVTVVQVDPRDEADEQRYLERAAYCWEQAESVEDSSGPKWAAESAKYERLAQGRRDKINDAKNLEIKMRFKARMAGVGVK